MLTILRLLPLALTLFQQQVQPLKEYRSKGIGVLHCTLLPDYRSHNPDNPGLFGLGTGRYCGVRVTLRKGSPCWTAGMVSGDVIVRINDTFVGNGGLAAESHFKDELVRANSEGKNLTLWVERPRRYTEDILLLINVTPSEGLEDLVESQEQADERNPAAHPQGNYSSGGIGLADMQVPTDPITGEQHGRVTVKVQKDSPAWTEGLRDGDEIIKVNDLSLEGRGLYAVLELRTYLIKANMDEPLNIIIRRPTASADKLFSLAVKKRRGVVDREFPPQNQGF